VITLSEMSLGKRQVTMATAGGHTGRVVGTTSRRFVADSDDGGL